MTSPALTDQAFRVSVASSEPRTPHSSVAKMLRLLTSFPPDADGVGMTQMARRTGISKSTAFRLLVTLEQHGFVERVGRRYRLSWRVFELGLRATEASCLRIDSISRPHLCELFADTGAAVTLAVRDGRELVCTQRIEGVRSLTDAVTIGSRLSLSCTAAGKAVLAFSDASMIRQVLMGPLEAVTARSVTSPARLLDELRSVRRDGLASEAGEWRIGLSSLAAPVLQEGRAVAAVSLTMPSRAFNPTALRGRLMNAADSLAVELAIRTDGREG